MVFMEIPGGFLAIPSDSSRFLAIHFRWAVNGDFPARFSRLSWELSRKFVGDFDPGELDFSRFSFSLAQSWLRKHLILAIDGATGCDFG